NNPTGTTTPKRKPAIFSDCLFAGLRHTTGLPSNGTQCFTDAPSYSRTLSISSKLFLEFIPKLWGRVRLCFGELCAIETASEHPVHLSVQFIFVIVCETP